MSKTYQSPFSTRYAGEEMSYIFSPYYKYLCWRKLWIALAKVQQQLGLPITDAQIVSMKAAHEEINLDKVADYEKTLRHDVMAHLHAFGDQCPEAKGIIHWGATSCYVTDNGDLIQIREGLKIIRNKLVQLLRQMLPFAMQYAHLPTLSYTHLQPAQPTTVGKRTCLWLQDFLIDTNEFDRLIDELRFLGVKGATGTQASFLSLFNGDQNKVKSMEESVSKEMGFSRLFSISGQTYTRKQDILVSNVLSSFAASAHKCATDIRLLAHLKEVEEPFGDKQVGSSAMPYKRNPMRSERICSLSRYLMSLHENPLYTEATQWLERSLDDSANRRLYLPESFLCADAILNLLLDVTSGLIVHPRVIEKHLQEELPFLATEHFLMEAVKKGKDRQAVHERLRFHSLEVGKRIKEEGLSNDLLVRLANDPEIGLSQEELMAIADGSQLIGRSIEQTHEFLNQEVLPVLKKHQDIKVQASHLSV